MNIGKDNKTKKAIDEERIQTLEAHIVLINKDLINLTYEVDRLLEIESKRAKAERASDMKKLEIKG